jgi:RNA polymerase sigma-70 factor (ECF subfamily)
VLAGRGGRDQAERDEAHASEASNEPRLEREVPIFLHFGRSSGSGADFVTGFLALSQQASFDPLPALVYQAAQGDRGAAAAVCRRFVPVVRAFARRRVVKTDAVDEFTQDVMLVLIEALGAGKLEQPERLAGFVLGICRNLARDRARQRERRVALLAEYAGALAALESEAPDKITYEILHLEDCLSSLSQRARDVVRLAYAEAMSHVDVAQALSLSEGNARVLRHRSLNALRECMSRRMSWEAT